MAKRKIYLSQGPYTDLHRRVCDKIGELLEARGCEPVTVGQNAYGIKSTVEQVRKNMNACSGAVVVAFRRFRLAEAVEKPGTPDEKSISGRFLPTVWNHLEATFAYGRNLPLLILVEQGVYQEGMLSEKTGLRPIVADLDMKFLKSEEFTKTLEDWLEHLDKQSERSVVNIEALRPHDIFHSLSIKQWCAVGGVVVALLTFIVTTAFWMGTISAKL